MAFLAPLALIGLSAVSIPLLVHLIRREQVPRIPFSTLRFLKRSRKKSVFFQQVQQWLLLLLRMAAFALLALAFARPFMAGELSTLTGFAPRSVVILIDMSMSMRRADYAAQARREARTVLDQLKHGEEAALIVFAEGSELVREWTTDLAQLDRLMETDVTPTFRETRYLPALKLADQLLESARYADQYVYLISDFQAVGFTATGTQWRMAPGVHVECVAIGTPEAPNLAVTDVKTPARLLRDGQESRVLARVKSLGTLHRDEARVHLTLNNQEVSVQTADLRGKSEAVVEFTTNFVAQGLNRGVVSVEDAGLTADNEFFFTVNVLPPIRVLCVNGEASDRWHEDETYWLRQALEAAERAPHRVTVVTPGSFAADECARSLLDAGRISANRSFRQMPLESGPTQETPRLFVRL